MVISGQYNYSDTLVQAEVEKLTKRLESTSYISNSLYTESWLKTFLDYVSANNDYLNVTIDNEVDFIQNLKEVYIISGLTIFLLFPFSVHFFKRHCIFTVVAVSR